MNGALPSPMPGSRAGDCAMRNARWPRRLAVAAATTAAAGAGLVQLQAAHRRQQLLPGSKTTLRLPRPLMEALFGAVGEMTQVALLYPLDTLKVRCQASGSGAGAVLKAMLATATPLRVLSQLYAGVVASSLCSVAIGSLYYLTFCTAKRIALDAAAALDAAKAQTAVAAAAAMAANSTGEASAAGASAGLKGWRQRKRLALDLAAAAVEAEAAAAKAAALAAATPGPAASAAATLAVVAAAAAAAAAALPAAATAAAAGAAALATAASVYPQSPPSSTEPIPIKVAPETNVRGLSSSSTATAATLPAGAVARADASPPEGALGVNITAAVAAALVGALIEAPVELFKNQTKAGLLQGDMLRNMGATLRANGLRGWYWGFLPFCIKSLPFDVGELLTWGQLRDWQHGLQARQALALQRRQAKSGAGSASPAVVAPLDDTAAASAILKAYPLHPSDQLLSSSGVVLPLHAPHSSARISADVAVAAAAGAGAGALGVETEVTPVWPPTSLAGGVAAAEHWLVTHLPDQLWDAAIGAAAGAAAVIVSMPGDCVKTHMDTRGTNVVHASGLRSVTAFFGTGADLVARHGPGALYTGMWPRLCGMVPSTALYWIAVEGCRRIAEPYMEEEPPAAGAA